MNNRALTLFFLTLLSLFACSQTLAKDCTVLLHGLARTENSMKVLATALEEENYKVVNQAYDSRSDKIEMLAAQAIPSALKQCEDTDNINFVTHSMGGILLRVWLNVNEISNLRYVVMLGPPNQGSEVIDKLGDVPGFGLINGPAGEELGTDSDSLPRQLGKVHFKLGIIAGSDSFNPVLSTLIPGDDDGKVSIENTKVDGMTDHIVLPVTHTFMMRDKTVISQTLHFLKQGHFHKEEENK